MYQGLITGGRPQITLTNSIVNSNFVLETAGVPDNFYLSNANAVSLSNGVFAFTPTAQYGGFNQDVTEFTAGDVFYATCLVTTTDATVHLALSDSDYDPYGSDFHSGSGEEERLSSSISTEGFSGNLIMSVKSLETSGWNQITTEKWMLCNLTSIFGSNAPTVEQMDRWIDIFGWFAVTKSIPKRIF